MAGYQTAAQRNLTCAIRIRERRRQLRLTQAEVVDRVDRHGSELSGQALSAIENGRRLAVGHLPELAAALECTVSYLLGLTAQPDRWEPDETLPPAGRTAPAARPAPAAHTASGTRAAPGTRAVPTASGTNGSVGRAAPPRRSWILGPDVPDATPPSF